MKKFIIVLSQIILYWFIVIAISTIFIPLILKDKDLHNMIVGMVLILATIIVPLIVIKLKYFNSPKSDQATGVAGNKQIVLIAP